MDWIFVARDADTFDGICLSHRPPMPRDRNAGSEVSKNFNTISFCQKVGLRNSAPILQYHRTVGAPLSCRLRWSSSSIRAHSAAEPGMFRKFLVNE